MPSPTPQPQTGETKFTFPDLTAPSLLGVMLMLIIVGLGYRFFTHRPAGMPEPGLRTAIRTPADMMQLQERIARLKEETGVTQTRLEGAPELREPDVRTPRARKTKVAKTRKTGARISQKAFEDIEKALK